MNLKRAQSLVEYAILISIVIAALVGMQVYVKRGLQAKYKGAVDSTGDAVGIKQYEPYYADKTQTIQQEQKTDYTVAPKGDLQRSISSTIERKDAVLKEGLNVEAGKDWY